MGKAAVDLPDPLENSQQDVGGSADADDLLSQMADDEIQRLLAEAEVQRVGSEPAAVPDPAPPPPMEVPEPAAVATAAPEPAAAPAVVATEAPPDTVPTAAQTLEQIDEATARQLDSLFDELQAAEAAAPVEVADRPVSTEPPPAPPAEPEVNDPEVSRQLDDLFSQLTASNDKPQEPAAPPAPEPAPLAQQPAPAAAPATVAEELEEQVSAQVLAASKLLAGPMPEETQAQPAASAPSRFAWLVHVLEVLSSPLNHLPDTFRETLGKVAIVTLINAVAILLYILLFR